MLRVSWSYQILSSIAQEELSSISQNIRWANQKEDMKKELLIVNTKRFLGYDRK